MCIGVDAKLAAEFERAAVPPPGQFHAVGVAVDLHCHAVLAAGREHRVDVDLVAGSAEQ
jgi:hypothetical protein